MKKYLSFLVRATLFALSVWFSTKVSVFHFTERYYARNINSVVVPLWTEVALWQAHPSQSPNNSYLDTYESNAVIMRPEEFRRAFTGSKSVWIKFLRGNEGYRQFGYFALSGTQLFFAADDFATTGNPNGTYLKEAALMPDGRTVRLDLGASTMTWTIFVAIGWALITALTCALGTFIILYSIKICQDVLREHREKKEYEKGVTLASAS